MAFPTTQWGNIGNTLASTQVSADVYTAIPGQNATTPGSADGPILGNFQLLADGTFVQFLQALATFNKNLAGKVATATAWQNNFVTIPTAAANDLVICINDRSLANLTNTYCSWFTLRGLTFAQTAASVAAGKIVAASGTAGTLYGATAGTDLQGNMVNTVVVGGSAAVSPVYIM
jgi:hypothetical protein